MLKAKTTLKTTAKVEAAEIVPSRHFHRHESFSIGPPANTVTNWHRSILRAVARLEPRAVESYDCTLYRFGTTEDGQLRLVEERVVRKPRTVVSGFKAQQSGSGQKITDYTKVDDAFELLDEGLQIPEPMLREAIESFANANRDSLTGYELLQLARSYSLLLAARHGCVLGVTDL